MTRFCPRCKSEDISPDLSAAAGFGEMSMDSFVCNNCGWNGRFFPER